MLFESLIAMMLGASVFGLGIIIGAVIEFKRVRSHFNEIIVERDEAYHENMASLLQGHAEMSDRIKILQMYAKHNLDELRNIEKSIYDITPAITQELLIPNYFHENEPVAPTLRWYNDYDERS